MKVVMVAVMTINGKITSGDGRTESSWASAEDAVHFKQMIAAHDVIIMGRKTYQAANAKPDEDTLRLVLTRRPDEYAGQTVAGQLEFTDVEPGAVMDELTARGHNQVLIAGGAEVYASFLQAGLVDELFLTIEPLLFGEGVNLTAAGDYMADYRLIEVKQLNERGTLLLHYSVRGTSP